MFKSFKSLDHFSICSGVLLTISLLVSFSGFSQKFDIENKFHIKQDDKSIVFRVLDADESQLKKYNPNKNYYWFKSQKVLITQGGSSGSLLDGLYEAFYKNNQLAEKGLFKNGLKDGVWISWNPAGILVHQERWSKGKQLGKQFYYNEQGILQKTIIYKSNQTQIIARDTTVVKTKKTVLMTINDSLGRLISQSRYSNFQLDGTQISRDQNDSLIKTVYKKGVLAPGKTKSSKTKTENASTEKLTFKQKMGNFWEKLKFWKKIKKKKAKDSNEAGSSPEKVSKTKEKREKPAKKEKVPKEEKAKLSNTETSSDKDEKRKEKKKHTE